MLQHDQLPYLLRMLLPNVCTKLGTCIIYLKYFAGIYGGCMCIYVTYMEVTDINLVTESTVGRQR